MPIRLRLRTTNFAKTLLQSCLAISVVLNSLAVDSKAEDRLRAEQFVNQFQPLLRKYCVACHGATDPQGNLAFHNIASPQQLLKDRATWLKVLTRIRADQMPPQEKDVLRPTAAERQQMTAWLDDWLNRIDCSGSVSPGHVTMRRLNRVEYRNTIRDLTDIDYRPTIEFPSDDVGYGFDNIGDVLSLSPILLEKYLAAADEVVRQIPSSAADNSPIARRFTGNELKADSQVSGEREKGVRELFSNGEMSTRFQFPRDGEYELFVMAGGDQAGDEPVRMAVRIDRRDIKTVDVKAPRFAPGIYRILVPASHGEREVSLAFLNDFYNPAGDPKKGRDRNLLVHSLEVRGPVGGGRVETANTGLKVFFVQPSATVSEKEAVEKIVRRFGSLAFRRPITAAETSRLIKLYEAARTRGESYETAVRTTLQAVLVSPQFLFRIELAPAAEGVRELDSFEIASRLSYFLWSSMPDGDLFRAASENKLHDRAELARQITRMLRDSKSQALVENFAGQWLQLRQLDTVSIDRGRFAAFDDSLKAAMRRETELFFAAIMRENRPVTDLLTGRFTFVNEQLANHYGLPGIRGEEFQRVSLEGLPRVGVLTHGSVLTVTSNPTRTSPVKRGKWVLDNLLNEPPPPPPPNVPELANDKTNQQQGSLRQRMEQHRANPACASCHQQMDALGFALENFDAIGRWRKDDGAHPIDAAGELPSGERFDGVLQLVSLLRQKKQPQFIRCCVEKMLTYALGRGLEYYDQCTVEKIVSVMAKADNRFETMILEIVLSEPFQKQGTRN